MDIKSVILSAYNHLPPKLRRIGTNFNEVYAFYKQAQFWPREKIDDWQLERFRRILKYAYEHTDGYRQLYDEAHIKPEDIRSLGDICFLPFTDKGLIRDNLDAFTRRGDKKGLFKSTTGGSTGVPFSFYVDKANSAAEYGFMCNAWESIGWKETDIGIKLRGVHLGDEDHLLKRIGYHQYALSSSFMTDNNYEKYIQLINKTKATYLHVYPSTIADLSHLMIDHNDEGRLNIMHIFLGSENLYSWQKELINQAFPTAQMMSWYGHTERAIWAPWCEKEQRYHLNPFYGYNEILQGDKRVQEGEVGEMVGTAFWVFGTPFIRYRTNDFAEKGPECCEKCGRQFQLINYVDGRLSEIIVGKTGRRISLTVFAGSIMHGKSFDHIVQFRFIQYEAGKLQLSIIPTESYCEEDRRQLMKEVSKFLGEDFEFEIKVVESLSRTLSGKYTYLEQHLPIDRADNINYRA